ncbi:MAG: hypothetical protein HYR63_28715 [Proteobacteria bacterium]|nr:hypothetical protein [Pseudomonadota bacterium]MBI3496830.1 hypothetical protein [Pseudomonadota bacterium]
MAAPAAAPLPAQSGAPAVAPAGVQPPAPQAPAGFQVDTLQSVEADTVGALAPGERALALSMWAGTPRPIAERLLGLLPSAPASRALFDLQRRLLLSASLNPEGAAGETRIVVLRAEKLLQMGDLIGVNRLLQSIPQRDVDDRLARLKVDAAWLVDDVAGGCAEVRRNLARSRAEVWQRGQAFCLMLDGDKEKADLAARLLPEQGFAEDATFTMLMDALAGNERARLASLVQPRPLDLAMLRAAHRPIPADAASSRDLRLMAAIALSVNAEGPIRLAAGERIEAAGAWSPGDLQKLYASVEVAPEALANAVSAAEMDKGPWGRAILWQAVRQKDSAPARTPFIERALALAGSPQAYAQQARLYAADLAALEPRGELLGLAATLARALEAAGRADAAQRWIGMLEAEAPRLPDARRALDGLWLLNTLAQPSAGAWQQERFESWRRSLKGTEAETEPRIATALILIEASGQKVPPLLWRDLVTLTTRRPAALPPAGLLPALAAASDERRLAESVALAEIALGETALAEQPAMVLGFLVQRLRAVDFAEEARAFALEAAIAAGL